MLLLPLNGQYAIDPENIGLQIIKADILAHSGQYQLAITTLEDALALNKTARLIPRRTRFSNYYCDWSI